MSFIGAVGVVAQQGNNAVASAPTGVSIATSASGNYNNAIASGEANCNNETMTLDGSEFSSNLAQRTVAVISWNSLYSGCSSSASVHYQGYIRATGATSFAWSAIISDSDLSNGTSAAIVGTASTSQDETSDNIGKYLQITFGGGRGGLTFPANDDTIDVEISASATNGVGTTNAANLEIEYTFDV